MYHIPLKECSDIDGDCMGPQLFVKETYCGYNNMTSLTMYTINNKSLVTSLYDGCAVDFDEPLYLNNTFYFECDTETSCFDESKAISRDTYYLECEEVDIFSIMYPKEHNESTTESYLQKNEAATEHDDKSTAAYGNSSEVYTITNETTSDLDGLLNNGLVKSTKAVVFTSESSTAVESISKNDIVTSLEANGITTYSTTSIDGILINNIANSSDTNVITTESSTAVNSILNHDAANSSEAHVFTTKTNTEFNDELDYDHNSSKETTTKHNGVLKDINTATAKIDELSNNTDARRLKAATENSSDSSNVLAILGYSLAGFGAILALAFGAYRLKNAVQSGSYLIPETPRPPGFIELA
ncbi:uncharacterized protein LOC134743374 [Cydia strobilella]|uniref:uncharacterized protein LOC134743374 n=1 Tax=Cydia strobilella TaxID=1100964 RepID=UPI003005F2C5